MKNKTFSPVFTGLAFIAFLHLTALLLLTVVRILFIVFCSPADGNSFGLILRSIAIGLQFDNWVLSFITALPLTVVGIATLAGVAPKKLKIPVNVWYFTFVIPVFILGIADIPYFLYFNDHINIGSFSWFAFAKDTFGMIFLDWHNYLYLSLVVIFSFLFIFNILRIEKIIFSGQEEFVPARRRLKWIPVFLLMGAACFAGMRGSFQRYPLRIGVAYFSDNNFYNRVGLNPVFNIVESCKYYFDESAPEISEVDMNQALLFVQKELEINVSDKNYHSSFPLKRKIIFQEEGEKYNVVVILMESVAAADLERTYNGKPVMPFLSQLRNNSLYFSNFYSAGNHTNCGITATLYGYTPDFAKPTMTVPSTRYTGLPDALKKLGYKNHFFITGNPQYDRMNSFLYDNHFERLHSSYDYPNSKQVNNFGVADDYLFEYGLQKLDELAKGTAPFFATFLTVSNHPPYIIPDEYKNCGATDHERILAFADHCLQQFVESAQKRSWGPKTLFVLLGDHGNLDGNNLYDMPLQYNHIPCFVIGPDEIVKSETCETPGSQIDLGATLMGLLHLSYTDNSMGTNLMERPKKYAYFVGDNHIGCCDGTYFFCHNINSKNDFLYKIGDSENLASALSLKTEEMRQYCYRMMAVNNAAKKQKWTE